MSVSRSKLGPIVDSNQRSLISVVERERSGRSEESQEPDRSAVRREMERALNSFGPEFNSPDFSAMGNHPQRESRRLFCTDLIPRDLFSKYWLKGYARTPITLMLDVFVLTRRHVLP